MPLLVLMVAARITQFALQVAQQQHDYWMSWVQTLDDYYLWMLGAGFVTGGVAGGVLGSGIPGVGTVAGALFGSHTGMLAMNEYHTDLVLLFNALASLPPSPSAVQSACGAAPSPIGHSTGTGGHRR